MPDPIPSSLRAVRRLSGLSVEYRRGSLRVPLRAIPGKTEEETADAYGARTVHRFEDWIVEASDLAGADGQAITPEAGDTIQRETPAGTSTYQVTPPDPNRPPWRAIDQAGLWLRIHTQQIET